MNENQLESTGWFITGCTTWILWPRPWLALSFGLIVLPVVASDSLVEYLAQLTQSQAFVLSFLPMTGCVFTYILTSNWLGALVPWALFEVPSPNHELGAPTNDLNTTACLGLLTTHACFYTGLREYGALYVVKYVKPVAFIAPLNLLEEFSKPLSLAFRLLGNIPR